MAKQINDSSTGDLREIFDEMIVSPIKKEIKDIASQTEGFDVIKQQLDIIPSSIEGMIDKKIEDASNDIKDTMYDISSVSDSSISNIMNGIKTALAKPTEDIVSISGQLKEMVSNEDGIAHRCSNSVDVARQALACQITGLGTTVSDAMNSQTVYVKTTIEDQMKLFENHISDRLFVLEKRNKTLLYLVFIIGTVCLISLIVQIYFLIS